MVAMARTDTGSTTHGSPPTPRRARLILAAVVASIAMITVGAIALTAHGSNPPQGSGSVRGATSTEPESFALPALRGQGLIRLTDYRGSPVVVTLFASWCTACRGELPVMARAAHQLEGRVRFVGVNSRENGDGYAMARQYGLSALPLARDIDGLQSSGLHDALKADGMPVTAFYSPAGKLLGVSYAALSDAALHDKLVQYYGIAP